MKISQNHSASTEPGRSLGGRGVLPWWKSACGDIIFTMILTITTIIITIHHHHNHHHHHDNYHHHHHNHHRHHHNQHPPPSSYSSSLSYLQLDLKRWAVMTECCTCSSLRQKASKIKNQTIWKISFYRESRPQGGGSGQRSQRAHQVSFHCFSPPPTPSGRCNALWRIITIFFV